MYRRRFEHTQPEVSAPIVNEPDEADAVVGESAASAPSYKPASRGNWREDFDATPAERAESARIAAKKRKEEAERQPFWWNVLQMVLIIVAVLATSALIKTFLIQAFNVPSASMESTLLPGDKFFVNRMAKSEETINRGDVVVFVDPGGWLEVPADQGNALKRTTQSVLEFVGILPANDGRYLVKRVIGKGGDEVSCCTINGKLSVNGKEITEPYLAPGVAPSTMRFDVTVPKGSFWVMGDNRSNSKDSRWHQAETGNGFVPEQNITGRAWFIWAPFDRAGRLANHSDVFAGVGDPAPSGASK